MADLFKLDLWIFLKERCMQFARTFSLRALRKVQGRRLMAGWLKRRIFRQSPQSQKKHQNRTPQRLRLLLLHFQQQFVASVQARLLFEPFLPYLKDLALCSFGSARLLCSIRTFCLFKTQHLLHLMTQLTYRRIFARHRIFASCQFLNLLPCSSSQIYAFSCCNRHHHLNWLPPENFRCPTCQNRHHLHQIHTFLL